MKRKINFIFAVLLACFLTACASTQTETEMEGVSSATVEEEGDVQKSGAEQQSVPKENNTQNHNIQEDEMESNMLVAYFSCTGTTEIIGQYAAEILGADIYEIIPAEPYTEEDLAYYTGGRADQEQDDPAIRPEISGGINNMEQYDTIILGYPIWHGQAPRIISTFLESYDFSGKTILPFCTSHSSGIGSSDDNLHSLCPSSVNWLDGQRFGEGTSKETIAEWLQGIL